MNINFSKQMLSSLLRTLRSWSNENIEGEEGEESSVEGGEIALRTSSISLKKKKKRGGYFIRNLTGFNVYWAAHKDLDSEEKKEEEQEGERVEVRVLPDNAQQPLGFFYDLFLYY